MFSERRFLGWATDWAYKAIANYGIRPYRLLLYTVFFVLLGAFIFSQPGALDLKDPKNAEPGVVGSSLSRRDWKTALGVSIHQFLPVDVPVGSALVPASREIAVPVHIGSRTVSISAWPSIYATVFLRLTGAVLVGIGLGSITGLLRRVTT
jgi:hypothetical protein